MIYLDNNATTRPADEVIEVMHRALREQWANPSSIHRAGQAVRHQIELAREQVARLIGCRDRELVFTSGGTEAINLAIRGSRITSATRCLVTDRLEHSAVRDTAEQLGAHGREIVWLETDADGIIQTEPLRLLLESRANEIQLVSVMWANNETGVIQPIEEIGAMCRLHNVKLHVDGTQYVGKLPVDVAKLPIDLMSFAAHKFHGPKGAGALYIRQGVKLKAQMTGGPQERERRGGTENVTGILGMGEAARLAASWLSTDARNAFTSLRDDFEQAIVNGVSGSLINGQTNPQAPRLWNTTNIAFPNVEAEALLLLLSERGVYASAGAACSSGSLDPSPVLLAMGLPEDLASSSVRFSISRETTSDELTRAEGAVISAVARLR